MPGIEELDPLLQSLQALKPPGASKSKITAITTICVDNPQIDSTIAQKLYSHFKKTAPTHKLGILFVVDSVTRQWIDRAKSAGQELSATAHNGTYASGVQRLTELMPSLIDDLARIAPQDQKAKISNLVEIWDRGSTFPPKMIADFKLKLNGPQQVASATPPGSPPQHMLQSLGIRGAPAAPQSLNAAVQPPAPDAAGLLAALAGLNKPQAPVIPQPPPPVQAATPDLAALLAGLGGAAPPPPPQIPQQMQPPAAYAIPPQFQQSMPQPPPAMPVAAPLPPQLAAFMPTPPPVQAAAPPPPAANPLAALAGLLPPSVLSNPQQLTQALTLFGELAKNNIPQDQWGAVLAALYPQATPAQPAAAFAPPPLQPWQQPQQQNNYAPAGSDISRKRDRSRSPDRNRNGHSNGNRRPSPVYGTYNASNKDSQTQDDDGRGRRQNYRQRSPPRNSGNNAPSANGRPKNISHDPSLPPNTIRVLSRTLFVGGCMAPEYELRQIFASFGEVQTCIANNDKRHAFVKMCTRKDALAAKAGMEELAIRDPTILTKARQTKWGVGFGPRDCCDYATGESIVPISSLTEADLKWALTAEYGGTGGQQIVPGMVIEEPDIEIGAGVSSKAMSKRLGPNEGGKAPRGGRNGGGRDGGRFRKPDNNHGGNMHGGGGNQQQQQRFNSPRPQQDQPSTYQPPPPVPQFGFSFAMPGNNGPQY